MSLTMITYNNVGGQEGVVYTDDDVLVEVFDSLDNDGKVSNLDQWIGADLHPE